MSTTLTDSETAAAPVPAGPGSELIVSQWGEAADRALRSRLPGVDLRSVARGELRELPERPFILLALPFKADPALEGRAPAAWPGALRWAQLASVGIDNYPRWLLDAPLVTTANGTSSEVIAEFALACILAANKSLPERWISGPGDWRLSAAPPLRGSVLGLVGYGGIGQALAAKAIALGMRVIVFRRSAAPAAGVEVVTDIGALLARSDHVVLAAPGTPQTRHLVDREALRRAKPGLHLVNVARGSLVDQQALLEALDDGRVGRASLDVTDPEPLPAGHPFYTHRRVRLSPHTSAISEAQQEALVEKFLRNLERFRAGMVLEDVLSAERIARGY